MEYKDPGRYILEVPVLGFPVESLYKPWGNIRVILGRSNRKTGNYYNYMIY